MYKILLVEDDDLLNEAILTLLSDEYHVRACTNITQAKEWLDKEIYDLHLIDIGLPDGSGIELCSYITSLEGLSNPLVLVLSGKAETSTKVACFEIGADDYIIKPVQSDELRARIRSKIKKDKNYRNKSQLFKKGIFTIDHERNLALIRVSHADQRLDLSPTEFKLLSHFLRNEGRVYSRDQLISLCFGSGYSVTDRTIDTHISTLRKKIGNDHIQIKSHYKIGYSLEYLKKVG